MDLKDYIILNEGNYKLHHYTTLKNLLSILLHNKLKGNIYPASDDLAIATVRPSMASKKNLDSLSKNTKDRGVLFIFDTNKLNNVKVKPVSEFQHQILADLKRDFKLTNSEINKLIKDINDKTGVIDKISRVETRYRAIEVAKKFAKENHEKLLKILIKNPKIKKIFSNISNEENKALKDVKLLKLQSNLLKLITFNYWSKNREGEERIELKKNADSLKLDPKYIKVQITNPKGELKLNDFGKKMLRKEIEKRDDLFIKDDNYKRLIKRLS
jgi:6-pyruvoyl-tetrahydropterin synthase